MKVYKTVIRYEITTITEYKMSNEEIERVRYNIQSNLNQYNRLNSEGKLEVVCDPVEL